MVVKTAQTSELAAAAQNSTLEFILVNHPLDCPVCDKGGECPLQDLTFRYGPGATRMTFDKRTFEKPIPISPTIALDRERCILCYRCTRFSEDVAEDGQLIARDRGALSQIATYERPAVPRALLGQRHRALPGGRADLDALPLRGPPWEIVNVPTVCGLCPVGCNVSATIREGHVRRVSSRNNPEIDRGWICDKGRFSYPALRAADRVTSPVIRVEGTWRFAEASWGDALAELERLARAAGDSVVLALSGSETVEIASALSQLVRRGFGSHRVVLPEETSTALDAYRAPLSAIADAEIVVVIGDDPVAERAPIVDLWIRAARRNGAEVMTFGPAGTRAAPARRRRRGRRRAGRQAQGLGKRLHAAERVALIWSGPGGRGGARSRRSRRRWASPSKPGSGAYFLPATPNGRGVAAAWEAAGEGEPGGAPERVGLLLISGEEAVADPRVRALAERSDAVAVVTMFSESVRGWTHVVLPGTSYLERDGTMINLEGREQRLRKATEPPSRADLDWIAELAARFGVTIELPDALPAPAGAGRCAESRRRAARSLPSRRSSA